MFLDESVLQDQRLFFRVCDNKVDNDNPVHERWYLVTAVGRGTKVGANPVPEMAGLPHVEDDSGCVLHEIDTGSVWKMGDGVDGQHVRKYRSIRDSVQPGK